MKINKKIILLGFVLMVIIQWCIPASTIWSHELTLREGEAFKFKTLPVDPNDVFRGKYVILRFPEISITDSILLKSDQEEIYCVLTKDSLGFAKIEEVSLDSPIDGRAYFKTTITGKYNRNKYSGSAKLKYPFDRFYLEENKAPEAERRYNEATRDEQQSTYALVKVRNGMTVLENVYIDGHSILEQ